MVSGLPVLGLWNQPHQFLCLCEWNVVISVFVRLKDLE